MNKSLLQLRSASVQARRPLWCSECLENHPGVYFTHSQRISSSSTRTCISRQGHIRVCSHASLSWSDLERFNWGTLNLECGRNGRNVHPLLLKIETARVAKGARGIKVTIHTFWNMFQQTSSMTGSLKLPSAKKVLKAIAKSAKDEAASNLCPHASFNPAIWQMQLRPQHRHERALLHQP